MCRNAPGFQRQTGLGLPVALFVITVMALLVLAMTNLEQTGSTAYSGNVLSMRAFYAAESGAQSGLTRVFLRSEACAAGMDSRSLSGTGLEGCSYAVDCVSDVVNTVVYYTFTSTGSCSSGPDSATRIVQVRASD